MMNKVFMHFSEKAQRFFFTMLLWGSKQVGKIHFMIFSALVLHVDDALSLLYYMLHKPSSVATRKTETGTFQHVKPLMQALIPLLLVSSASLCSSYIGF